MVQEEKKNTHVSWTQINMKYIVIVKSYYLLVKL